MLLGYDRTKLPIRKWCPRSTTGTCAAVVTGQLGWAKASRSGVVHVDGDSPVAKQLFAGRLPLVFELDDV